jgi:hypothetical protein
MIQETIDTELQAEAEERYKNLNIKLDKLQPKQQNRSKENKNKEENTTFYKRTENLTNIHFNKEEMDLLDLGPQHSIEKPLHTY